ncbi:MAG TPA: long-chain fatty acid--CoA ligase [Symbiobacteriaceae bacterium]|nr:long-chain fatty acid--CoA ligase [Symbiobacteriaceae bacterium]
MRYPLTVRNLLERSRTMFPNKEIVSRMPSGVVRHTYAQYYQRVSQLAHALTTLGVGRGDRVATFGWNHHRHLEAYFAVPCMGAVLHTVNIRLPAEHIVHILNHAEDKVLLVDEDLLPAILPIWEQFKTVEQIIVMADKPVPADGVLDYETLIALEPTTFTWPEDIDEWEPAGLCYTSATTGSPKAVLYAHRAIFLHSMLLCMADTVGLSESDSVLPVVPMFHVNAWGLPFASVWMGAKQVLPGARPHPADIAQLMQDEKVTLTAGVPTVWLGLLQVLEKGSYDLSALTRIACGGSAVPRALAEAYRKKLGLPILHAYGMTEAAPLTHVARLKSHLTALDPDGQQDVYDKQGLLVPGLEIKIIDADGKEVPWDGKTFGEVVMRGPWIADEYYKDDRSKETFYDGWYHSGDIGVIDPEGYLKLVDRAKDVIKSGGEWISSVDLENAIMAFPGVAEAAVIACPHAVWDERPLACVVPRAESKGQLNKEAILQFLRGKFPHYWVPDDAVFLDELPKTGTGKFDKKVLRGKFKDHFQAS